MRQNYITIIISVVLSLLIGSFIFGSNDNGSSDVDTSYDRIVKSGTLKCGYYPSPTFLDIDPNTGEMSGIVYDYVTQLGKNTGLKIEWVEEVGVADYITGLKSDRFDAYCTALTMNSERAAGGADFLDAYIYDRFDIFVRQDDDRFDHNLSALNAEGVQFVALEGDIFAKIIRKFFPKGNLKQLSQLSSQTDPLLYVATGKADVVLSTPLISARYMKNNPNKVRLVKLDKPFIYANTALSIKGGQYKLKRMLDIATLEMQSNGQLDFILDKHDPEKLLGRRVLPFTANQQ